MYSKLLKDLGVNEEVLTHESPSRVLKNLLKAYINSSVDSEELKNFILDYARKNDIAFLCPKEWLTSVNLNKAEQIDHSKFLFTIKTEGLTAEFIRSVLQALKDAKTSNSDLVVSLASSEENLPEKIVLSDKSLNDIFETEENYLVEDVIDETEESEDNKEDSKKEDEKVEKAQELEEMNIQVIAPDTSLETLLESVNKSQFITLDPDGVAQQFPTEDIFVDSYVISEPNEKGIKTLRIEGSNLVNLSNILTSIGEIGNEGYTFPILVDGEYLIDWEGDVTDYVVDVVLNKAVSTTPFNIPFNNQGLNREQAQLQETLSSLGVLLEVLYVKNQQIFNVYVDVDADTKKIEEIFAQNCLSLIAVQQTVFYKVLTFAFLGEVPLVKDEVLQEVSSYLFKAKKGTPGYDKWLEEYKQARGSKEDIMSKEELGKVLESNSVKEMLKMWKFRERRQQAEEELERMLKRRK